MKPSSLATATRDKDESRKSKELEEDKEEFKVKGAEECKVEPEDAYVFVQCRGTEYLIEKALGDGEKMLVMMSLYIILIGSTGKYRCTFRVSFRDSSKRGRRAIQDGLTNWTR